MPIDQPTCEFDDCYEPASYVARRLPSFPWQMCCTEHSKFVFMFDYGERYELIFQKNS